MANPRKNLYKAAIARRIPLALALAGFLGPAVWACDRPPAARPNFLSNAGFETDANLDGTPDGWTAASPAARTTAVAHRDAASLHVTGPAVVTLSQNVSLSSNTAYSFTGHVRTQNVTGSGVRFRFIETDPSTIVHQTPFVTGDSGGAWQVPHDFLTTQPEHRAGRFEIEINITGGQAWIDDVYFCPGLENCDRPFIVSYGFTPGALGVSRNAPISFTYNELVGFANVNTWSQFEVVEATADNDGDGNTYPPGTSIGGVLSPTSPSKTFTFVPSEPLKSLSWYRVTQHYLVTDLDGQEQSPETYRVCFQTAMDKTTANTFVQHGVRLQIPANALASDGRVDISTAVSSPGLAAATRKLQELTGDALRAPLPGSFVDLTLYDDTGARVTSDLNAPATLAMPYADADNDGIVDGTNPPVKARTLAIHTLDETRQIWTRLLGSEIDTQAKTVIAPVPHFSVFALIGQFDTSLDAAYAFPVPFRASQGHRAVTFAGLGQGTRIKIYTATGDLVRDVAVPPTTSTYDWDVANADGVAVGSGVYYYRLESGSNTKKGKLVVVR